MERKASRRYFDVRAVVKSHWKMSAYRSLKQCSTMQLRCAKNQLMCPREPDFVIETPRGQRAVSLALALK